MNSTDDENKYIFSNYQFQAVTRMGLLFVGPLPRVRPRNGILALFLEPLRSEFIGEL